MAKPFVFLRSALDGSLSSSSFKSSFINLALAALKSPLYNCFTILRPRVSKSSSFKLCGLLKPDKYPLPISPYSAGSIAPSSIPASFFTLANSAVAFVSSSVSLISCWVDLSSAKILIISSLIKEANFDFLIRVCFCYKYVKD